MGILGHDSKFMQFMGKLADVLLLNLLWLACSLPVITIGASTAAAYYVALKLVDDEEGHVARGFFRGFKANWRQGTALWLLNAAALYALYLDYQIVAAASEPSIPLIVVGILSSVFVFSAFVYSYPQIARYETTLRRALGNSVRICTRYLGKTLILVLAMLLEIALFSWNGAMIVIGILIGPTILIYTIAGVSKRVFSDIERGDPRAA